ncbi:MAG: ribonuclease HI family protein [Armatimonadota bacterium]
MTRGTESEQDELVIDVDGCSLGNPGDAAIGVVIAAPSGDILWEVGEYIGEGTNNIAEYQALLRGLRHALSLGAERITINTDSELLQRQLRGEYRVRAAHLRDLHGEALRLLRKFRRVRLRRVPREMTTRADGLARQAARSKRSVMPDLSDDAEALVEEG